MTSGPPDGIRTPSTATLGNPRVLVVEDEAAVRDGLVAALALADYRVAATADGLALEDALLSFRPDLVLLDVFLDRGPNGFELARQVRAVCGAPMLFLTAADSIDERLRGFELGADDYIVKPFAISEVLARVRAVLRRSGRLPSPVHEVRDLIVDEDARTVRRAGRLVDLSVTEFDLLAVLARKPETVFSKTQLLVEVWGFAGYNPNLVEVCMSSLRRKLETDGARMIFTMRGMGYVLRR